MDAVVSAMAAHGHHGWGGAWHGRGKAAGRRHEEEVAGHNHGEDLVRERERERGGGMWECRQAGDAFIAHPAVTKSLHIFPCKYFA